MKIRSFIPGLICIIVALIIMFRLMHYASFYAPSYFFWIGVILTIVGIISLIRPLVFLFILNRGIAGGIIAIGILISMLSLLFPVHDIHSSTSDQKIDTLMPYFSFNEFHEVKINASFGEVKQTLQVTGVKDIPAAHLLMKIRGIANDDVDMGDRASKSNADLGTFSTPDFNFFVVDSSEFITMMIIKSAIITDRLHKPAPPEVTSFEQFVLFNEPGYVKVAMSFRFISADNNKTLLTTETRVRGVTQNDSRIFARYWRIVYPGSAIIRRVWLDTIKKKTQLPK